MSEHADSDEFVEINPARLSGAPAVRGTRIFAETVRSLGWDTGTFYDVDDYTISGVLAWWERHPEWVDRRWSQREGAVVSTAPVSSLEDEPS